MRVYLLEKIFGDFGSIIIKLLRKGDYFRFGIDYPQLYG